MLKQYHSASSAHRKDIASEAYPPFSRQQSSHAVRYSDNVFDCRIAQRARRDNQPPVPELSPQPATLLLQLAAKLSTVRLIAKTGPSKQWRKSPNPDNTSLSRRVKYLDYDNTQSLTAAPVDKQFTCHLNEHNCWLIEQSGQRSRSTSKVFIPPPQSDWRIYTSQRDTICWSRSECCTNSKKSRPFSEFEGDRLLRAF